MISEKNPTNFGLKSRIIGLVSQTAILAGAVTRPQSARAEEKDARRLTQWKPLV